MAERARRRQSFRETPRRENDRKSDVSTLQPRVDDTDEDQRLIRERLVEYFRILREWDLKLKGDQSEDSFDLGQP